MDRKHIVDGVTKWTIWWIDQRKKKFRGKGTIAESMALNPLMAPILTDLHGIRSLEQLGDLLLAGHFMAGHSTGFGKLIDEKILPDVFGTTKLNKAYRKSHASLMNPCFDDVDHWIARRKRFLSLKASQWTINLTQAVGLNNSFAKIRQKFPKSRGIDVGVIYGKAEHLTDKYDILRGITAGALHGVKDLRNYVKVIAGRKFWAWLNEGQNATQDWVLEGILKGVKSAKCREECRKLRNGYKKKFVNKYSKYRNKDGGIKWQSLLSDISG